MPSTASLNTPSRSTAMSCDLFHAVQMHVQEEAVGRPEAGQLLADEHAVGTQVDVLLALEDLGHQLFDRGIDHRLAAADADDRRAALVDRRQALLDGQLVLDRRGVLANPPAAGAGQVAGVQGLEHQHQRKPLSRRRASCAPGSRPSCASAKGEIASGGPASILLRNQSPAVPSRQGDARLIRRNRVQRAAADRAPRGNGGFASLQAARQAAKASSGK